MSESTTEPRPACCVWTRGLQVLGKLRVGDRMMKWVVVPVAAVAVGLAGYSLTAAEQTKKVPDQVSGGRWIVHDLSRPRPAVVTPGTFSTQEQPGTPPSDAVVLFDGKDLGKWTSGGKDATWKVQDGYFQVDGKQGIETRDKLGDVQLHVEWAAPTPATGSSQERGNSGVYLMGGRYEIQVLDTFENVTYADGGATAVYGQNPPLVNACRKPGEWQVYDIVWRGPRFDPAGKVTREATVTVFHNGVLTQDHYRLTGPSRHYKQPPYEAHPDKLPLVLQNHNNPVRYRNIWYRPLPDLGERNNKIDWTDDQKPAAK